MSLDLINEAFSALQKHEDRFLTCERAYKAEYKDNNRTTKLKSSQRSKSRLYIPLIKTTVSIIHSIFKTSFMSDRCPIEITRVGLKSDSDLVLQNALTAVLKNQWRKKQHKVGLSKAVLSSLYLPLGAMSLFYDKNDNEIKTRFVPINDIAFDRYASDINDIEYVAYRWAQSKDEIKEKIKSGFYKIGKNDRLNLDSLGYARVTMKDIYKKQYENGRKVWQLSSYANDILVRKAKFVRLPFHFGYCLEAMPSISKDIRSGENGVYGSCISELARELQEEYNIKRNQKIDITENLIDPPYFINKATGALALSDMASRKKFMRVELGPNERISDVVIPLTQPSSYPLSEEIGMLKSEYEIITGVNSVMTGQTSPSDRRAMGALQVVNASSSIRIESMLQTLCETMLHSYAEHFVELIYKHTSDYEFIKITEDSQIISKIGTKSERINSRLDFDVSVNFGTTIANEMKIGQLNNLLGVMAQNGLNSPEISVSVIKEILSLILGENAPLEMIDQALANQQEMIHHQQAQQEADEGDGLELQALINSGV